MLKLYVDAMIRLNHSTTTIKNRAKNIRSNEDGFAAAEQIALAVAGVLIVGLVYVAFKGAIDGFLKKLTDSFGDIGGGGSTDPTGPPAT